MQSPASAAVALLTSLLLTCAPAAPRTDALMAPDPSDRGRYLALHVSLCVFCHSEIDWKGEGAPPRQGAVAAGRAPFSETTPCRKCGRPHGLGNRN